MVRLHNAAYITPLLTFLRVKYLFVARKVDGGSIGDHEVRQFETLKSNNTNANVSDGIGQGSTFTFWIPYDKADEERVALAGSDSA